MKIIAGNWKMNHSLKDIQSFFAELNTQTKPAHMAWIAPQTAHLSLARTLAPTWLEIGAQTCSEHVNGAFTGESNTQSIKDSGASFVIIGHSERRQYFQESNATLNAKVKQALSSGLTVIYCVGETLSEREANATLSVIKDQLLRGLADLGHYPANLLVAYEPVWAIGTGKVATPAQAQEVHAFIRETLKKSFGDAATKTALLYGGSVKPDNAAELLKQKDIDGALVGGASLKAKDFLALCQTKI